MTAEEKINVFDDIAPVTEIESIDSFVEQCKSYFKASIQQLKAIEEDDSLSDLHRKNIQTNWYNDVRDFNLLLRDVAFRYYKESQLLLDENFSEEEFQKHNDASISLINDVKFQLSQELTNLYESNTFTDRSLKHYHSPFQVIKDQIETFEKHCNEIVKGNATLINLREVIDSKKELFKDTYNQFIEQLSGISNHISTILNHLKSYISADENDRNESGIINTLKKSYQFVEEKKSIGNFKEFPLEKTKPISIPFDINEGELIVKDINFSASINDWMESNIFSRVRKNMSLFENHRNSLLLTIFNGSNRLQLISDDDVEFQKHLESLYLKLQGLLEDFQKYKDNTLIEYQSYYGDIKLELNTSRVFNDKDLFLPRETSFMMQGYRANRTKLINSIPFEKFKDSIQSTFNKFWGGFGRYESGREDLIDYISARDISNIDRYDHVLFFSKGYLGRSFIIDRPDFDHLIKHSLESWQKGYAGSMLVYGKRLSGRSTLLESMENYTNNAVVNLHPQREWKLNGNKYPASYHLNEILTTIQEKAITNPCIVVIDDLEIWRNQEITLYENINALLNAMKRMNRRMYFVISTNRFLYDKLNVQFNLKTHFSHQFNSDYMNIEDIIKAIKIRFATTIRENQELHEHDHYLKEHLVSRARTIARGNHGNIGMSLMEWASHIKKNFNITKRSKVFNQFKTLIEDHRTILTYLLKYKYSTEEELSQITDTTYMGLFRDGIRTLISYRIVNRDTRGTLTINEMIINDVEDLLNNQKQILS